MSTWTHSLLDWLADFYILATALLLIALLAGSLIRQPIKRYFVTSGAVVGLAFLAMLCAMPFWPRWFFIRHTTAAPSAGPMIAAAPPLLPPAETDIPFPVRPPLFAAAKPPAEGALPVVRHSIPRRVTPSETPSPAKIDLSSLIAVVFMFGAGIVTIWLAIGALRVRRLCRSAIPPPEIALEELKQVVGSKRPFPRLLISHLIDIAAAWGLWRPTILLPASAFDEFTQSPAHPLTPSPAHVQESGVRGQESAGGPSSFIVQRSSFASLRMLLAHELAHIRRGDLWLLAASRLLLIVLFIHPLYWLLRRRLRFDQELLADALAAQICGRQEYAECLFNWARELPTRRMFPAGALGIWNRPGQLSRRIAMLLDERIRLQSACSRLWKIGATSFAMSLVAALSLVTLRPAPIVKAQTLIGVPTELRTTLPITRDTPDEKIAAKVGSEIILVRDIKAFMHQRLDSSSREIDSDQFDEAFKESARLNLKHLVELKLVCNDAIHNIPAEGLKKAKTEIDAAFEKEELPNLMKAYSLSTQQDLENRLRKAERSLDWERRAYFEKQLYYGWIQQQVKIDESIPITEDIRKYIEDHPNEKQTDILKKVEQDHYALQIKGYLKKLRNQTPVWTVFDDQPGGIDGPVTKTARSTMQPDPNGFYTFAGEKTASAGKLLAESATVITGTCVDEQEKPIPNARVRLFRIDHSDTPVNYPSGRMKCEISPGFGDVPAGEQLVYGQGLYSPSSQRVLQETRSNEKGEFRFTSLSIDQSWRENRDVVFVIAQAPGKASMSRQVTINKNNDRAPLVSPLSVTMSKAGVLRGRVTNAAGQPVAGAMVWKPGELSLYKPVPGVACATTDAEGRYEIDDLYPFVADDLPPMVTSFAVVKYVSSAVSVQHPDFADGVIEYAKLPATADASLQAPATLVGRILVGDGREPAVKASAQVSLDDGAGLLVRADDAGRFTVPRLRPGKWHVHAWNLERPPVNQSIDLHAGENQLELRLQPGGTIKGRIVDAATGKPVVDPHSCASVVTAIVMGRDPRDTCQGSMNIDDGVFSIIARPGKNLIGLVNPFWKLIDEERWKTAGVEVKAGQTVEIELRLVPQVAPPPRVPQEPLNEKAVIMALKSNGGGVNTETINGEEYVTEIYTIGCDETGARSLGLPPIGWLEKNVLLNIKKFPKLRTLGLTTAGGDDSALEPLRGVQSLETLCIGGDPDLANQTLTSELTMAAFDHFATLPNLKMLYVISPHFDDRAFGYLDRWPKLEGLMLGGSFSSTGLKQLRGKSQLKQLGIIAMAKAKMGDECLDEIGALADVEGLALSDADEANPHHWTVTDDGLAKLAGLTKLSSLTLQCPQITNAGLVHLRGMKNLTHLDLKGTAVTQAGIDELKKSLPKLNATGYRGWKPDLPKPEMKSDDEALPQSTPGESPGGETPHITAKAGGAIQAK